MFVFDCGFSRGAAYMLWKIAKHYEITKRDKPLDPKPHEEELQKILKDRKEMKINAILVSNKSTKPEISSKLAELRAKIKAKQKK